MALAHYRSDTAIYQAGKVLAAEFQQLMDRGRQGPDDILNVLFRYKNFERFEDVQPIVKELSHVKMDDYTEKIWRSVCGSFPGFDLQRWGEFAELIDVARAAWLDRGLEMSLHEFIEANPKMLEKLGFSLRQPRSSGPKRSPGFSAPAILDARQVAIIAKRTQPPSPSAIKRPAPKRKSLDKLRTVVSPQTSGVITPPTSSQGPAVIRTSSPRRSCGSPRPHQGIKRVAGPALRRAESSLSRTSSSASLSTATPSTVSSRPASRASTATTRSISPANTPIPVPPLRKEMAGSTLRDRFQEDKMLATTTASEAVSTLPSAWATGSGAVRSKSTAHHGPRQLRRMPKPARDQRVTIAV